MAYWIRVMSTNIIGIAKKLLPGLDWSLFKDSSVLTFGMILARGLGFLITMLLARHFEPADFGLIQYATSVAGIIAIGVQPFGQHVLSRYIGMFRTNQTKLREYMSNIWSAMGITFCISLVLAIPILLYTGKFNIGILAIFLGISVYYAYYGLARGFLASGRLATVDIGNNILQVILILILFQFLDINSTLLAMLIRGLVPIVPVILLQRFWTLPNAFEKALINRDATKAILKFSLPIWVSHASYMLYGTVAVLFLEHFTDNATVGIYSLAATMGIVLSFFPSGLATLLMPKIAGAPDERYKTLLAGSLGLVLVFSITLVLIYYFFAPWFIGAVFGSEYLIFPKVFVLMALAETFAGAHTILTTAYVGRGRAEEETKSRLVALLATFVGCWLLIPSYGVIGAVWARLFGAVSSLIVYGFVYMRDH
jgi:O-antigen/teichoic acid export membrane protein